MARADAGVPTARKCLSVCCWVVDAKEFVVVALIRMGAESAPGIHAGIREIIHASIERGAISGLVVKTERVAYLLAQNMQLFVRIVVERIVEIRIVDPDGALRDVETAQPNLRDAEPAVVPILTVADLDHAYGRPATRTGTVARHDRGIEHC